MRKWMICVMLVAMLGAASGCVFLDDLQKQYEENDQNAHKEKVLREGPNQHDDPNPRNLDEPWKVDEEKQDKGKQKSDAAQAEEKSSETGARKAP